MLESSLYRRGHTVAYSTSLVELDFIVIYKLKAGKIVTAGQRATLIAAVYGKGCMKIS